jgi:hypothetical protein
LKIFIEKGEKLMSGYMGLREGKSSSPAAGASKIMNHHTNGGRTMRMSKRIFKPAVMLFVLSVMLFSASLRSPAQRATDASPNSNAIAFQNRKIRFPKISITITFGRASKNCGGIGICKITLGRIARADRGVRAELSRTDEGKLEITLLEKAPENGPTLYIDEDIPLSSEITKKLGLRSGIIQRGAYAFSANKSRLNAR